MSSSKADLKKKCMSCVNRNYEQVARSNSNATNQQSPRSHQCYAAREAKISSDRQKLYTEVGSVKELIAREDTREMGWLRAKNVRSSPELIRWTSYRKLRRCKENQPGYLSAPNYPLAVQIKSDESGLIERLESSDTNLPIGDRVLLDSGINCTMKSSSNLRTYDRGQRMNFAQATSPRIEIGRADRHIIRPRTVINRASSYNKVSLIVHIALLFVYCILSELIASSDILTQQTKRATFLRPLAPGVAYASLIIGDSAIEIQEVDSGPPPSQKEQQPKDEQAPAMQGQVYNEQSNLILGSADSIAGSIQAQLGGGSQAGGQQMAQQVDRPSQLQGTVAPVGIKRGLIPSNPMPSPLPPIASGESGGARKSHGPEDVTDGDKNSRKGHDYDLNELGQADRQSDKNELSEVLSANQPSERDTDSDREKAITGKVVDFELTPAGGHNKAKIKKKKKKKKKEEEEAFKKWGKKKKAEKKAMEKKEKEHLKKKKEEGKKGKKKWGKEIHGQKKKGKFKKKKWGKKVKKGKGVKKGKKGRKFLKDKGHKNTGFKTVYHKEEWGKSSKWHDVKREKKWDEKSKKWKKKWKKEKGKKYKGDHMKKFEKKKKSGKKYKKENKEKFKKAKKEEFKKGMKKKMEEHGKKKEGGAKKQMKEEKKKKKKKS